MSKENNLTDFLTDVASAIKDMRGIGSVNAQNFSDEIRAIGPLLDTLDITENGNHNVKDYKNVSVLVESNELEVIKTLLGKWDSKTEIKIPYGVEYIYDKSMYKAGSMYVYYPSKIYFPTSIKELGMTIITSNNKINVYYEGDVNGWINITKGKVDSGAYKGWTEYYSGADSLKVYFNNQTNDVGDLILSNNTTELKMGAFSLTIFNATLGNNFTLTIPKSVKTLNAGAFYNLKGFKKIVFEEGSEVTFPTASPSIFHNCEVEEIELPIMTIVPSNCFINCTIKEVHIKEGATTIERQAISSPHITKISLPNTLKTINDYGFSNCSSVPVIEIPESVESMGSSVFSGVNGNVEIKRTTPCTITSSTFPSSFKGKIYVPKGTSDVFKSATNWSVKASIIYEKYVVVFNVPSALLNNETITYSIDGGKTYQQFTNAVLSLNEVATIKIKSTDSSQVIKIGTSAGASDVGTISNSELTFSFTTDTNVYLTIQ